MPFIENIKEILLSALQYPTYARPEYFLKKQVECGWSKLVFLKALKELCAGYTRHNYLQRQIAKSRSKKDNYELIELSLAEETNGNLKFIYTSNDERCELITDDLIYELREAIEQTSKLNELPAEYSDLQIISFFENAIKFIKHELEVQAGMNKETFPFGRAYPKGFTGFSESGKKLYLIHNYYIKCPEPYFHYYSFKHALRNLLLNSRHADQLQVILKPYVETITAIVTIWNDVLHPLQDEGGNTVSSNSFLSFKDDTPGWSSDFGLEFEKAIKGRTSIRNYDFVKFASDAGNIIENEVIKSEQPNNGIPSMIGAKPTVAAYALMHVYWSKYDITKAITKTNNQVFAEKYSISANSLLIEFGNYADKKSRQQLPDGKQESKLSVLPFIKRFEDACLMLQQVHSKAHTDAFSDLEALKRKYATHLD